jgi:hypothetical protein
MCLSSDCNFSSAASVFAASLGVSCCVLVSIRLNCAPTVLHLALLNLLLELH